MSCTYNGIDFVYPKTDVHMYGPGKDASGSDQIYTNTRFSLETLLNVAYLPAKITDSGPANIISRIRHYLTQPRQPFYYDYDSLPGQTGPNPVFNIPGGRDDGTGPWPDDSALVVTYTTPGTLLIKWAVDFKLRYCGNDTSISVPLSLRWEDSLTWDQNWKASYRRNGTIIISSFDTNGLDFYRRNSLMPPVAFGFRRTAANYSISRDGLRADFTFTDEQLRFAPPGVSTDMRIVQSETAPIGPMRRGSISVRLVGIQNANVTDLARWALIILYARLLAAKPLLVNAGGATSLPGTISLETSEDVAGVEVAASCSYRTQPDPGGIAGVVGLVAAQWAAGQQAAQFQNLNGNLTQQGNPSAPPLFPWVGTGTTATSPSNPGGFASWANPTGAVGGPAPGVGLAAAVSLYAALLNDPCGSQVATNPNAGPYNVKLQTTPNQYNTLTGGGAGGQSPAEPAQLSASLSVLNASQYPTTIPTVIAAALWATDNLPGVYDHWQTNDEYLDDAGTMVAPVCNTAGKNVQLNYSSQQWALYRRWSADRVGAPPQIPPRVVNLPNGAADPNWVYVGGSPEVAPRELGLAADGVNIRYQATGVYIFQAKDPALVVPASSIPPFFDLTTGRAVAGWISGATLVGGGILGGQSGSPLGNTPLG